MKPERTQPPMVAIAHDRPEEESSLIEGWRVDEAPNAITRHFPHANFGESVGFLGKVAEVVEQQDGGQKGATPFVVIDAAGVTIRLGNPPGSGVNPRDLELAAALTQAA